MFCLLRVQMKVDRVVSCSLVVKLKDVLWLAHLALNVVDVSPI